MSDTCVLILNLNDKLDFVKFEKFCNQHLNQASIVIASKQDHNKKQFKEYLFQTDNDDEVLNTLLKKINAHKLIIVRDFDNNNFMPIVTVLEGLNKDNQICLISKKCGKVKNFFKSLFAPIIRFMFGYNLLFGGLGCIGYGKVALDILKQLDNPSFYTKVDKWSGIDIKRIQASNINKVKFKPKVSKNYVHIAIIGVTFVLPLLLWIFIPFFQKSIALKLLSIFVMGLCFALICIDALMIVVKHIVGENSYENAKILNEEIGQND